MDRWADCPIRVASLVFFDLETTGLRPDRGARITEIAVVGAEAARYVWASDRSPPPDEVTVRQLRALRKHLRDAVVVGHNLQFDFGFLAHEADRLGLDGPRLRFIDTLGLARRLLDAEDARLDALVRHLDLDPEGELHTALGDARATRALFWRLVDHGDLDTLGEAGLKQLHWSAF